LAATRNPTVAQSAIVSSWFQGKELSFAFGINLSVARIGSSINGPVETWAANDYSVGFALMIGFVICLFSLLMAVFLVVIDAWAAKKDGVVVTLTEDDKFKFKDLKQFNRIPFWLVTMSCCILYMVIFPYIQYASDMLRTRYGFGNSAGTLYALPYIISGVCSPILGFIIDKKGKRPMFSKFQYLVNSFTPIYY
jgi:MFS family permease